MGGANPSSSLLGDPIARKPSEKGGNDLTITEHVYTPQSGPGSAGEEPAVSTAENGPLLGERGLLVPEFNSRVLYGVPVYPT